MLSVPEYYSGKNVLITGGTGFLGKALVEKLLRSCPDIGKIYLLIRNKRGKDPQERLKQITDNVLYDHLKQENPSSLNKIKVINGNTQELGYGLSQQDEELIISEVHVIFHCAADVNFDIPLKSAILTNIRGAREMSKLALKCKKLDVLVFVSTMYSNCDLEVIDEKVYRSTTHWRDLIDLAEDDDSTMKLDILTQKIIHPFPNTYTYTKKMAEQVFNDMCKDKVPLVISRPSIVSFALKEPIKGWCDNLNGPWALLLIPAKGIADVVYGNKDTHLDFVFIDSVIKTIIISAWKKSLDRDKEKEVTVYNISSDFLWKMDHFNHPDLKKLMWTMPVEGRMAYGGFACLVNCWWYYYFFLIINNVLPALFFDLLLKLSGKKTMVFHYVKKIYIANSCLQYFMGRTFIFKNNRYKTIEDSLLECDRPAFTFRQYIPLAHEGTIQKISEISLEGMKRFVLHEKWPIAPETHANTKKFYTVSVTIRAIKFFVIMYVLFWKWNVLTDLWNKIYNYVDCL